MGFFICTKTTALKNYANNLSALLLKKRQRRRGNNNFGLMFFKKKWRVLEEQMPQSLTSSLRQTMFWHVSFLIGGLISKIKTTIDELHAYIVLKKWNLGTFVQFLNNFLWSLGAPPPPIDGSYNNFQKTVDFRHWSTIYFNIILVHKHLLYIGLYFLFLAYCGKRYTC